MSKPSERDIERQDIMKALNLDLNGLDYGVDVQPLSHLRQSREKMIDVQSCLKDFEVDKSTEICCTFKPQLHDNWNDLTLKEMLEDSIRRALKKAPTDSKILLIGEHSSSGLLHYHGMMQNIPNNYISNLRRKLNREIGRTIIKQISYFDSYKDYMFKSYTGKGKYIPEDWTLVSYIKINI